MICPFCNKELSIWDTLYSKDILYCNPDKYISQFDLPLKIIDADSLKCTYVPQIEPHYFVHLNDEGKITYQGYKLGGFFIQANIGYSNICNEDTIIPIIIIKRSLWINSENIDKTLTTIKTMIIMS